MLTRMLEEDTRPRYSPHVDKNLDYLHTSLQLDMISMVALESRLTGGRIAPRDDATE